MNKDQKIKNIKALWESVSNESINTGLKSEIKDSWKYYVSKIENDQFSLSDFASKVNEESEHGGYLMNFLERTTSKIYGSSKPGSANYYGIKLNDSADDKDTYYIDPIKGSKEKKEAVDLKEATEVFNRDVLPFLKALISAKTLKETINVLENKDEESPIFNSRIKAKQLLTKIVVLKFPKQLLSIYLNPTIDTIHEIFCETNSKANSLEKNAEIVEALKNYQFITSNEENELLLLTRFLWKLISAETIFDHTSKNTILYGPPGTGKTYAVKEALKLLKYTTGNDNYEIVQFHPSYDYEDFIEGIKPKGVTQNGSIKFEMVNGHFKSFCIKAKKKPKEKFFFIIDEINRANLSSVFGELLYCLEYRHDPDPKNENDEGLVKTQYSSLIESLDNKEELAYHLGVEGNVWFGIPDNIYVIGMMNDVDKSIDAFDLALRRRFKWIKYECSYQVIEDELDKRSNLREDEVTKYIKKCKELNNYISGDHGLNMGTSFEFGHSFFLRIIESNSRKSLFSRMDNLFQDFLRPTLKEYLRGLYSETEIEKSKLEDARKKFTGKSDNQ
jgi:hypothetical protein